MPILLQLLLKNLDICVKYDIYDLICFIHHILAVMFQSVKKKATHSTSPNVPICPHLSVVRRRTSSPKKASLNSKGPDKRLEKAGIGWKGFGHRITARS